MELEWLYYQRIKVGEESAMRMAGVDKKDTQRQVKGAKKNQSNEEAELKRQKEMEVKI